MLTKTITGSYDLAVVGGGIAGLAHAYCAAKKGLRVIVLERSLDAQGASIRNFGLIWPIGQAAENYALALRSRQIWEGVLQAAAIYHQATGSLHLAYREDEENVAREFAQKRPDAGYQCAWLNKEQTLEKSKTVRTEGLRGALWSPTEITVDPRAVLRELPRFLEKEFGVEFRYGAAVTDIDLPTVRAGNLTFQAHRAVVCPGSVLDGLFGKELAACGLIVTKLQMLRTAPQPGQWQLGPALAGGLTLRFYHSFQICASLKALQERIARETPEFDRWGIHTMVSQGADGSLTFGDSHEYGNNPSPFLRSDIEDLIVEHIRGYLNAPNLELAERWYGIYAKHPTQPYCQLEPAPGVTVLTGLGGAGMTLSFGVAERLLQE